MPRKAARAMLLTDLSLDEIGAVLGEINEAEDIARTASVCKAFKLAAQHAAKARAALYGTLVSLPTPKKHESLLRVLRFAENMMNLSQATLAAGNGETLIAEVKVIGLGSRDEIHVASRKDVTDAVFSCGMGEVQPMMLSREGDLQVAVSASRGSFFVVSSGCVWSWGENDVGQLGLGDTEDRTRPTPTPEHLHLWNTYIWQVAAGGDHALFLTEAGDVLAVGDGELGQLGILFEGVAAASATRPKKVRGFAGRRVTCVSAGHVNSAAVDEAGGLWTWGRGDLGQGGRDDLGLWAGPDQVEKPTQIKALKSQRMCHVSIGGCHMLATTLSGELYAWGRGYYGCLGLGERGEGGSVVTPTLVTALSGKPAWLISAGEDHSVVGTEAGVYTMGNGQHGMLGHGDEEDKYLPTRVRELSPLIEEEVEALTVKELKVELESRGLDTGGVKAVLAARLRAAAGPPAHGPVIEVAAGYHHTLARTVDGSVFSWGSGADRVLAHGDDEDRFVPTRVDPAIFADPQLNDAQTIDGEPANE